jgi:hypothetical protein
MRSVGNVTRSMRSKLGNMFTRKNRGSLQEETFGIEPPGTGGRKSKKSKKNAKSRTRITKK